MNGLALCAGVGGLELGLHIALGDSYRTVGYVEREASAVTTLVARMEDKALGFAPVWDDLKTFDGRAWRGRVDIITAGYPCQPFSVAGRRKGEADPRHLWPHVARVIRECEPRFVFLENVSNHLRLGFRSVAEDLRHMGYRVAATVLRAEEVGAPHRRERLFVLAHSEGFDRQSGPASRAFAPGPPGSVDPVAHAAQQRQREPHNAARAEPRENTRSDSGGGSSTVADSECSKRRSLGAACDGGSEGFGARGQADRGIGVANTPLDHPADPRRASGQRSTSAPLRNQARGSEFDRRCPDFPPGPTEQDRWHNVLVQHPELRPAISQAEIESLVCGMDDGLASRVDRLRACGNGVVALQAALAFKLLAGELHRG